RRVVAERHDLDPLQPHNAECLGPAPIVADAHADDDIADAPHFEAVVADLEITLFEMLKGCVRKMLGVPWQGEFAVSTNNPAVTPDQDRGVVAVQLSFLLGQLGIAQIKADAELAGETE